MSVLRPAWAVAKFLDVPVQTVYSWVRRGRITAACDVASRGLLVDYDEALRLRDHRARDVS